MLIKVYDVDRDNVIKSSFATGVVNYSFAIDHLAPLIGRFDEQRKKQSAKFYSRLKQDILQGCIIPPITIAFVSKENSLIKNVADFEKFLRENIQTGYILDGMQRLNTLLSASKEENFDPLRSLYLNIIIAERHDLLLYRMITLNNGQKPMTARHQIEILTKKLLEFKNLRNIIIQNEKDTENRATPGAFKLGDISAAYTAFLANNVNNDNNKIIESKMDEILVTRVMEGDITSSEVEFDSIIELVDRLCTNHDAKKWMRIPNNLIGLSVAAKKSFRDIAGLAPQDFVEQIDKFEEAFKVINRSKVNVGRYRRELIKYFFEKIDVVKDMETQDVEEKFISLTTND